MLLMLNDCDFKLLKSQNHSTTLELEFGRILFLDIVLIVSVLLKEEEHQVCSRAIILNNYSTRKRLVQI